MGSGNAGARTLKTCCLFHSGLGGGGAGGRMRSSSSDATYRYYQIDYAVALNPMLSLLTSTPLTQ